MQAEQERMTKLIKNLMMAAVLVAVAAPAGAQVGVSISVGEPGFYGQLNIGGAPAPQLIYPQPVVIAPAPQFVGAPPIYLRVPPGYAKHWSQHCARYGACGRPVYFVRDDWYLNRYVPYYRGRHGGHDGPRFDHDRGHDRGHYDRGDHGDRGRGHGNHDHDRGHGNHDH
ncbi:hypothetical protein CDEF62S_05484 [Castellaniella defragrans]